MAGYVNDDLMSCLLGNFYHYKHSHATTKHTHSEEIHMHKENNFEAGSGIFHISWTT